ncbi:TetR/AcrR family transcriptional regulator [Devosia rhodophyticola]|uniref:TetR/AcrR family transcriptional regulator n=1 Tax=Devosia rhodophyticola TaxID=3026423 RepID=A0ABY7YXQ9_9HYPH|nr:TetR/AcrR family transcriptional regulator [Devosia rhodophyticola]WDR06168.1 TetR/AcrR family transcriptional regulator [Devosia rhodophyticola]
MQTDDTKPRTRDRVRTREHILEAARQEFAAKGFEGARTDDIARRANVSKRMPYHYFHNKDGLFQAVLERTYTEIREAEKALELSSRDPMEAMAELVVFSFDWFNDNPTFIPILNAENLLEAVHAESSEAVRRLNTPLVDAISELLKRGVASGQMRADVDPVELYISIAGISYFYFSNQRTLSAIFARKLGSKEELARRRAHVSDIILGYLRP